MVAPHASRSESSVIVPQESSNTELPARGVLSPSNHTPIDGIITTSNGAPVQNVNGSQRIGHSLSGPLLLQDINLMELIQNVGHERIPERVVHANGVGAHGYFEVTEDISDVTSAKFLSNVGKQTRLFARFSTTKGETGSADTVRDARGFAFKLFTEEGNLDWTCLSTPVFPIRDGAKFPSFTHATKPDPHSGMLDFSKYFDFFNRNQEATHFFVHLFSDHGTPYGYQHADCFGINTYRFTKEDGSFTYVRLTFTTNQGRRYLTNEQAVKLAGEDPDFHRRSIFETLESGKTLSWDVHAQLIDPEVAAGLRINIFDSTKLLPEDEFPLRRFGRVVLTHAVDNAFTETEQSAFSPTNLVPGWALSPDPILQARILSYTDTQRYRLGTNFAHLPINQSEKFFNPLMRNGAGTHPGVGRMPNYLPSIFYKPAQASQYAAADREYWAGTVVNYESEVTEADFAQTRHFWNNVLPLDGPDAQDNLAANAAAHLCFGIPSVREESYALCNRISPELGRKVRAVTEALVAKKLAAKIAMEKMGASTMDSSRMDTKASV